MPIITIKVFQDELTTTQAGELIGDITEAVIPFVGEALRNSTWVLVEEIKNGSWGIGNRSACRMCEESSRRSGTRAPWSGWKNRNGASTSFERNAQS
jgi:4-oxalocrotonate tautomerase